MANDGAPLRRCAAGDWPSRPALPIALQIVRPTILMRCAACFCVGVACRIIAQGSTASRPYTYGQALFDIVVSLRMQLGCRCVSIAALRSELGWATAKGGGGGALGISLHHSGYLFGLLTPECTSRFRRVCRILTRALTGPTRAIQFKSQERCRSNSDCSWSSTSASFRCHL